jgi:large subunit ribosomal protein L18
MALTKRTRRQKIKQRIRKQISGTGDRPRMTVFRSNKQIYVQLVNDLTGETVMSASSKNKEVADKKSITKGITNRGKKRKGSRSP